MNYHVARGRKRREKRVHHHGNDQKLVIKSLALEVISQERAGEREKRRGKKQIRSGKNRSLIEFFG
jgi:hypothetical protein